MKDLAALRVRYEKDSVEVQIGGLASNLSRMAWCMKRSDAAADLSALCRESKYFAEWAANRASLEMQGVLAEVQLEVALWERMNARGRCSPEEAEQPKTWAQRLLRLSGLIAE